MNKKLIWILILTALVLYSFACETRAEQGWETSLLAYSPSDVPVQMPCDKTSIDTLVVNSKWIKFADDPPFGPDKIEHFMNFLAITFFCHKGFGMKPLEAFITSSGLATAWEIKDGAIDWKDERFIITIFGQKFHLGGDGISIWDGIWSALGSGTYYLLTRKGS